MFTHLSLNDKGSTDKIYHRHIQSLRTCPDQLQCCTQKLLQKYLFLNRSLYVFDLITGNSFLNLFGHNPGGKCFVVHRTQVHCEHQ